LNTTISGRCFACCFIVSNQARIGRGEISESEVLRRFAWADQQQGRPFTDWRLCPHGDDHLCFCRKPQPGMFLELASRYGVDLVGSLHVGDSDKDREAAARAGVGRFVWAHDFFGW
jgi:D-glycero-D-manno-heptose 1,7-bisphosphate phosphatase